ncbi:transcription antitermination factor NusB [bacterium]|nr:transcription antitermination factor NusB [bacterium]
MASRRKAREAILRALYMSESRGISIDAAFHEMTEIDIDIETLADDKESQELKPFSLGLDERQKEFALLLAHRIVDSQDHLNDLIKPVLINWDFSRISRIDRIILWIALAEMTYMPDIPLTVSINEAIELARKYSSEKSPSFINGILDSAARNAGILKPGSKE